MSSKVIPYSCNFIQNQLEELRNANGFIDFSSYSLSFPPSSRELIGNQNRIKNWISFMGVTFLLKGETFLDQKRNYGIYGELIVEEMGMFLNIPMAHYDLVKLKDENGHEVFGVLSQQIEVKEEEQLVSLHTLIGEEEKGDFLDATDYFFTLQKLEESLLKKVYKKENVDALLIEYKKRLAFYLLIAETDKHIENISFILGKNEVRLSPNYDSEASLLLDTDVETVKKLLDNYFNLEEVVRVAVPRIGIMIPIEEGGFSSYFMDTLEALIEEDQVYAYCDQVLRPKIDMDYIFERIEKRIHASLPTEVKLLAKYSYLARRKDFLKVLDGVWEFENF